MNKGLENTINKLARKYIDYITFVRIQEDNLKPVNLIEVEEAYKKGFIDATNLQDIKLKSIDDKLYSYETILAFLQEAKKVGKISPKNKVYIRMVHAITDIFNPKEEATLL